MKDRPNIRPAKATEADHLSDLALRAKAYWGYSPEFMAACRDELVVSTQNLENESFHYMIAQSEDTTLGYYGLQRMSASTWELEALFVDPSYIGTGIGRLLINHAKKTAKAAGGKEMLIQGDPNAEHFYLAAGGERCGTRESGSIPGRHLPLFTIKLV